jgi:hypothetical protein
MIPETAEKLQLCLSVFSLKKYLAEKYSFKLWRTD